MAVLITAIAKVFGRWAAYVSSDWNVETFDQCTRLVNDISKTLDDLVKTTSNVIVHERVSETSFRRMVFMRAHCGVAQQACQFVQLFEMIKVDIHKNPPRPTSSPSNVIEMPNAFAEDSGPNSDHDDAPSKEPDYPKSLYLLQPLFTAYELNSIGYKAQERVSLPEGLDLDKPCVSPHLLVPPPLLELGLSDEESESDHDLGMGGSEHMEALRDAIKKDEQNKNKKKKKTNKGMKPDGTFETREERAAVSRIYSPLLLNCQRSTQLTGHSLLLPLTASSGEKGEPGSGCRSRRFCTSSRSEYGPRQARIT